MDNNDALDDIARLLAVVVKLQTSTQSEAIREMSRSGLGPTRIAELLGTTANTVNVTIQKDRKKGRHDR
jgi:DNA-binding CsgD family transcriptional regulator